MIHDGYFDREGKPMSLLEWSTRRQDDWYQRVAFTTVGATRVDTVWLGIDHGYGPDHKPVIFETMLFGGPRDGEIVRYTTEQAALEGHDAMVARVREDAE